MNMKRKMVKTMDDLISRRAAIDAFEDTTFTKNEIQRRLSELPPVQLTIYGYNVEHLELIARILQKENMPPEKVVELLTDIERIGAIISDEFEEALRKVVEQCMI